MYNSVAPGGELVLVGLPASGWTRDRIERVSRTRAARPRRSRGCILKPDQISFTGGKAAWSYTLNEPSQGRVAAVLLVGSTVYCSDAPAKASGNPPSTATNDRVDKFVAQPNTPAPPFCVGP